MTPAVTSPAGVMRSVAVSEILSPTRNAALALISSGCTGAPADCSPISVSGSCSCMLDEASSEKFGAAERPSGFAEKALDLADGDSVNLCHSGKLHAVLYPTPDARHVRRWNPGWQRRRHDRSCRLIVPAGAGGGTIRSTRGLRADGSSGTVCWSAGVLTGDFDVNRASAAWRALLIRSRSSLRGCGWCCRLSKICPEWLVHSRLSKGRFGKYGKLDLGRPGAIRRFWKIAGRFRLISDSGKSHFFRR
jgi:hypothetical protein